MPEPMACPQCGKPEIVIEMRASMSARVYAIDWRHKAAGAFFPFDSAEWEVDDVYCDDCGWDGSRDVVDYEWLGDYPPEPESVDV